VGEAIGIATGVRTTTGAWAAVSTALLQAFRSLASRAIDSGRLAGFFSKHCMTKDSKASGISRRNCRSGRGASLICASKVLS